MVFLGIIIIAMGVWNILSPETAWHFKHFGKKWMYKNAEPSEGALVMYRIGGGIMVVIGVVVMFQ